MEKTVISLFSGAGGMDVGFEQAGFTTRVAVEQDNACCDTLRTNFPKLPVIEGDIAEISSNLILEKAGLEPLECDVLIGGPPCQSFSLAGNRMGMDDPRGKLLLEYVRVVRDVLPKVFVLENVRGMANWAGGKAIEAIQNEFRASIDYLGNSYSYHIDYKILKASDYGVPQHRERLFMVGNRLGKTFDFPVATHFEHKNSTTDLFEKTLNPYKTVRDAICDLPPANQPSEMAQRISQTIKERIANHGY